ncbi:MAG TPA: hypothetical protein VGB66_14895 [Longimicrobium sp.]
MSADGEKEIAALRRERREFLCFPGSRADAALLPIFALPPLLAPVFAPVAQVFTAVAAVFRAVAHVLAAVAGPVQGALPVRAGGIAMDCALAVGAGMLAMPHRVLAGAGGVLTPSRRVLASAEAVRTVPGAVLAHPDGVLPLPRRVLAHPTGVLPLAMGVFAVGASVRVARSCMLAVNSAFPLGTNLGRLRRRHYLRGEGGRRNRERQGQQPLRLHGFRSSEKEMSWGCVACPHLRVQPHTPERWAAFSPRRATPAAACARGPPARR